MEGSLEFRIEEGDGFCVVRIIGPIWDREEPLRQAMLDGLGRVGEGELLAVDLARASALISFGVQVLLGAY